MFIPGAAVSSEMDVLLCASYDGTSFVHDGGHAYFPADWLRQEFPKTAALVTKIEQGVREFFT